MKRVVWFGVGLLLGMLGLLFVGATQGWWSWKTFFSISAVGIVVMIIGALIYYFVTREREDELGSKKKRLFNTPKEIVDHALRIYMQIRCDYIEPVDYETNRVPTPSGQYAEIAEVWGYAEITRQPYAVMFDMDDPFAKVKVSCLRPNPFHAKLAALREGLASEPAGRDRRVSRVYDHATGKTVETVEELTPQTVQRLKEEEESDI